MIRKADWVIYRRLTFVTHGTGSAGSRNEEPHIRLKRTKAGGD